jgi:hypothetical protein
VRAEPAEEKARADPGERVLPELLSRGPGKERREGWQRVAFAARCSQFFPPKLLSRGSGKERREGRQRIAFAARCNQFFSERSSARFPDHLCCLHVHRSYQVPACFYFHSPSPPDASHIYLYPSRPVGGGRPTRGDRHRAASRSTPGHGGLRAVASWRLRAVPRSMAASALILRPGAPARSSSAER